MKVGFEREFFVKASGKFVLCPQVMPHDECGYLAESRGEAHRNAMSAAYLLLCTEYQLQQQARRNRVKLVLTPFAELEAQLLKDALRRYGKPPVPSERGNIYGLDYPAEDQTPRAGLHVHFSNQVEYTAKSASGGEYKSSVNGFIDMPKIIRHLDVVFEKEIKAANRIPGCYEIKPHSHGGFEYRSLPATIDPRKVATTLQEQGFCTAS